MEKIKNRAISKEAKIFNNSIRLFKGSDIKKVTMDDIASLSNVSKMTIYKYFGDKESLYQYIGRALLDRCYNELIDQFNSEKKFVEKMVRCTSVLTIFIAEENLSLCIRLGTLNDEVKDHLVQFNKRIRALLIDLIQEGKNQKLIYADISDECIYRYVDMGLSYFQHNPEYRQKILCDAAFRQEFMSFLWKNVFIDYSIFPLKMDIIK